MRISGKVLSLSLSLSEASAEERVGLAGTSVSGEVRERDGKKENQKKRERFVHSLFRSKKDITFTVLGNIYKQLNISCTSAKAWNDISSSEKNCNHISGSFLERFQKFSADGITVGAIHFLKKFK